MAFTDIEEYNMRSIATLGFNRYSQITVAHVTLPKAVLNTVKILAVYTANESFQLQPEYIQMTVILLESQSMAVHCQ